MNELWKFLFNVVISMTLFILGAIFSEWATGMLANQSIWQNYLWTTIGLTPMAIFIYWRTRNDSL